MAKLFLVVGSFAGFLAVILGAFGAHALRSRLSPELLGVYHTGVEYQFYHALALLVVGVLLRQWSTNATLTFAGIFFALGILLFSGSLYGLALTGWRWLGPVTPFGGLAFIVGWLCLLVAVFRQD